MGQGIVNLHYCQNFAWSYHLRKIFASFVLYAFCIDNVLRIVDKYLFRDELLLLIDDTGSLNTPNKWNEHMKLDLVGHEEE
ncbi:hypothetical protein CMV_007272 [Castanea mollissima]|uniref:Uncharacterized protein n=1 Tax=Castanea mollissima TaxID=60419 RepID=A0A8J4RFC9_9ROSI|nr:hypothetical protein CMV_007272 [Castanea mollissima]